MTTEALQEQSTMTPEVDTQEVEQSTPSEAVEQVAEPEAEAADDAFQAGFDTARGNEPEPEPEPPKLIAGFTEEQVKELLAKAAEVDKLKERESKLFGTLGSLKQSIDAIKSQPQAPQGGTVKLNGALKRLAAEFPEMAATLEEDLNEALQGSSVSPGGIDSSDLYAMRDTISKTIETKLLTMQHRDWREQVNTPEFAQWKGTLSPDELQVVEESWDAVSVSAALDKFKEWKNTATQTKQVRQSRLEAAITPRGNKQPTPSMSADDAFVAGFKSARGI